MTRAERALRKSLEVQIENATSEITRGHLRSQLQAITEGAQARRKKRASERAKKPKYTAEEDAIVPEERDRMRELHTQINAETNKKKKAELQSEWQGLLDAELQRFRVAHRRCIMAGAEIPTPTGEEFDDDASWDETMEWYRLDIAEASCYRRLNSAKTTMVGRRAAEKEIARIGQRRRELRPDDYESASVPEGPAPVVPEVLDLEDMEDADLRDLFAKHKFFAKYLNKNDADLIAQLEREIRHRGMLLFWTVEGTDDSLHVNEHGDPVVLTTDGVYMGEISLPPEHPIWSTPRGYAVLHPTQPKRPHSPSSAEIAYRNRGKA